MSEEEGKRGATTGGHARLAETGLHHGRRADGSGDHHVAWVPTWLARTQAPTVLRTLVMYVRGYISTCTCAA